MRINFASTGRVLQVIHATRRELLLALSNPGTSNNPGCDLVAADAVAVRGVRTRVYLADSPDEGEQLPSSMRARLARHGVEIESIGKGLPRMALVDDSVVIFAKNQHDYSEGALIGEDMPFTRMLRQSLIVDAAERPVASPGSRDDRPDPMVREILRQLAKGAKDEAAARDMGVALRTYRRMIAGILEQLDAQSRFQAGYLAAKRGWL